MSVKNRRHIIIAGSTKCGTTALFRYLSDHPRIAGSRVKETRYFLDAKHELAPEVRFDTQPGSYERLWGDVPGEQFLLEATPDYMYSRGIWQRLAEQVPDAHIIILLRNPVARLQSWYRYSLQRGLLADTSTFDDYVTSQLRGVNPESGSHPYSRALAEGKYATFLAGLVGTWRASRLHLISSEELLSDPLAVMVRLCRALEVEDTPYHTYEFRKQNVSRPTRAPSVHRGLSGVWRRIEWTLGRSRSLLMGAQHLKRALRPLYWSLNGGRGGYASRTRMSPSLEADVDRFYEASIAELCRLLQGAGQHVPGWALSHEREAH